MFVTHDLDEALLLADAIIMTARPGRVKEVVEVPFSRSECGEALIETPRFAAIGLKGREWIFAISIVFWSMSFVRITTLAIAGQYRLEIVLLSFALAAPAYVAQAGGFAVQTRFSPETFQRIVLLILLVASANLLW